MDSKERFLENLFQASNPREARGTLPDARELLRRGTERLGKDRDLAGQPLLRARLLDTLGGIRRALAIHEAEPILQRSAVLQESLWGDRVPSPSAKKPWSPTTPVSSKRGAPLPNIAARSMPGRTPNPAASAAGTVSDPLRRQSRKPSTRRKPL